MYFTIYHNTERRVFVRWGFWLYTRRRVLAARIFAYFFYWPVFYTVLKNTSLIRLITARLMVWGNRKLPEGTQWPTTGCWKQEALCVNFNNVQNSANSISVVDLRSWIIFAYWIRTRWSVLKDYKSGPALNTRNCLCETVILFSKVQFWNTSLKEKKCYLYY